MTRRNLTGRKPRQPGHPRRGESHSVQSVQAVQGFSHLSSTDRSCFCPICGGLAEPSLGSHLLANHPGQGEIIELVSPSQPDKPTLEPPLRPGDVVLVRYKDHVLFKDADSFQQRPRVMEAVGRLEYEDDEFIRLTWEQYPEPNPSGDARVRSTGLTILKSTIVELRRVSGSG